MKKPKKKPTFLEAMMPIIIKVLTSPPQPGETQEAQILRAIVTAFPPKAKA